jgi:DUF1680 family protein
VERTWTTGDKLDIEWPMSLRTEWLPHSTNWISVLWGPVVLAGELGKLDPGKAPRRGRIPPDHVPTFTGTAGDVLAKIEPVDDTHQHFRTIGLAKPSEVSLAPFYTVDHQPYSIYWRLTPASGQ